MKDLREIVSRNITNLRKENNLTQLELAQKINFSDKAISRWENGDVLPDVETIQRLSQVFGVSMSAILEEQTEAKKSRFTKPTKQDILSQIFLTCEVWIVISVIYAYLNLTKGQNPWQLFMWGVPAFTFLLVLQNWKKKNNIISFVYGTVLVWSFITCLFFHFLDAVPWYFFILGVPAQGLLIVRYLFDFKQKKIIKSKSKK